MGKKCRACGTELSQGMEFCSCCGMNTAEFQTVNTAALRRRIVAMRESATTETAEEKAVEIVQCEKVESATVEAENAEAAMAQDETAETLQIEEAVGEETESAGDTVAIIEKEIQEETQLVEELVQEEIAESSESVQEEVKTVEEDVTNSNVTEIKEVIGEIVTDAECVAKPVEENVVETVQEESKAVIAGAIEDTGLTAVVVPAAEEPGEARTYGTAPAAKEKSEESITSGIAGKVSGIFEKIKGYTKQMPNGAMQGKDKRKWAIIAVVFVVIAGFVMNMFAESCAKDYQKRAAYICRDLVEVHRNINMSANMLVGDCDRRELAKILKKDLELVRKMKKENEDETVFFSLSDEKKKVGELLSVEEQLLEQMWKYCNESKAPTMEALWAMSQTSQDTQRTIDSEGLTEKAKKADAICQVIAVDAPFNELTELYGAAASIQNVMENEEKMVSKLEVHKKFVEQMDQLIDAHERNSLVVFSNRLKTISTSSTAYEKYIKQVRLEKEELRSKLQAVEAVDEAKLLVERLDEILVASIELCKLFEYRCEVHEGGVNGDVDIVGLIMKELLICGYIEVQYAQFNDAYENYRETNNCSLDEDDVTAVKVLRWDAADMYEVSIDRNKLVIERISNDEMADIVKKF